jgi:hypothetical protein
VHIFDGAFDLLFGQCPIVIEINDYLFHEWFGQPNRTSFIAKVIVQDGERELLRARSFVRPLKTHFVNCLTSECLQRTAINCHPKPIDLSHSLIDFHVSGPP